MTNEPLLFDYTFNFENGRTLHFPILLDPLDLSLMNFELEIEAEWARLENHQCKNCTLKPETYGFLKHDSVGPDYLHPEKDCIHRELS